MIINNPSNPSYQEIKDWAYSEEEEPDQNWELFLIWKAEFELYLELASDIFCPKEAFFLDLLYYWVWANIKHEVGENKLDSYSEVFDQAEKLNTPYVRIWLERSKQLTANSLAFNKEQWWEGRRPYDV